MFKRFVAVLAVAALFYGCSTDSPTGSKQAGFDQPVRSVAKPAAGFDDFGYNYVAGIFSGPADGVDKKLDGNVWGDSFYAKDHLVMKWSKGWTDARFNGAPWGPDAWENNEWNGNVPGGSGEVWHYKIVWVGPQLENSPYWRQGGYPVWGQFEVILSQGRINGEHIWETHANPAGYGVGTK